MTTKRFGVILALGIGAMTVVTVALGVLLLSTCGGHGQDNKQGTSVVGQEHQQQEAGK